MVAGGVSPFILGWGEERRKKIVAALARGGLCILIELCVFLEELFDTYTGTDRVPPGGTGGFL